MGLTVVIFGGAGRLGKSDAAVAELRGLREELSEQTETSAQLRKELNVRTSELAQSRKHRESRQLEISREKQVKKK